MSRASGRMICATAAAASPGSGVRGPAPALGASGSGEGRFPAVRALIGQAFSGIFTWGSGTFAHDWTHCDIDILGFFPYKIKP